MGIEQQGERWTWLAFLAPVVLSALTMAVVSTTLLGAEDVTKPRRPQVQNYPSEFLEEEVAAAAAPLPAPRKIEAAALPRRQAPRRRGFSPPLGRGEKDPDPSSAESGETETAAEKEERREKARKRLAELGKRHPRLRKFPGFGGMNRLKARREAREAADDEASVMGGAAGTL